MKQPKITIENLRRLYELEQKVYTMGLNIEEVDAAFDEFNTICIAQANPNVYHTFYLDILFHAIHRKVSFENLVQIVELYGIKVVK